MLHYSVLFADDTCLTLADNYSNLINAFNSELKNAWIIKNRLSNFEETVYINFSLRKHESDQTLQENGISFSEVVVKVDTCIPLGAFFICPYFRRTFITQSSNFIFSPIELKLFSLSFRTLGAIKQE